MVLCRWVQAVFPQKVRDTCSVKWQLATACSVASLCSVSVIHKISLKDQCLENYLLRNSSLYFFSYSIIAVNFQHD